MPSTAVKVTTLDAFCEGRGIERVDVVKIDVEGYEAHVLWGGKSILFRLKPAFVVEFWTTGAGRAGSNVDEIAAILQDIGYTMYKPVRHQLIPITEPPRTDVPEDVFCFHTDRRFDLSGSS